MNGGDFKCAACALDTFPLRFEVSIRDILSRTHGGARWSVMAEAECTGQRAN
jgi:hypothetical protein